MEKRHFSSIKKSVFQKDACSRDTVFLLLTFWECSASEDDQSAERKNERSDAEFGDQKKQA